MGDLWYLWKCKKLYRTRHCWLSLWQSSGTEPSTFVFFLSRQHNTLSAEQLKKTSRSDFVLCSGFSILAKKKQLTLFYWSDRKSQHSICFQDLVKTCEKPGSDSAAASSECVSTKSVNGEEKEISDGMVAPEMSKRTSETSRNGKVRTRDFFEAVWVFFGLTFLCEKEKNLKSGESFGPCMHINKERVYHTTYIIKTNRMPSTNFYDTQTLNPYSILTPKPLKITKTQLPPSSPTELLAMTTVPQRSVPASPRVTPWARPRLLHAMSFPPRIPTTVALRVPAIRGSS